MSIVTEVIAELNAERQRIWLECPQEIVNMGKGIIPRNTGSHGQYLSTLMFAERRGTDAVRRSALGASSR